MSDISARNFRAFEIKSIIESQTSYSNNRRGHVPIEAIDGCLFFILIDRKKLIKECRAIILDQGINRSIPE